MSTLQLEVRGAPDTYLFYDGALNSLNKRLIKRGIKRCLFITGDKSWEAASPYVKRDKEILEYEITHYQGECSESEVERLARAGLQFEADILIGVGGGKVLDLTKAVGNELQIDTVLIPTLPSTCAAWTPLSVFYDKKGSFTHYRVFDKGTWLVIVEPAILASSPTRFLKAGIGDTVAKWYEARALTEEHNSIPLTVRFGLEAAKLAHEVLLKKSKSALAGLKRKEWNEDLHQVIEATIAIGGAVGGFAERFGRIETAHSIHNGLTSMEETHHLLHGEKVAYGILVQLVLENRWGELNELIPFYRQAGLPTDFESLGLHGVGTEKIDRMVKTATKEGESIHHVKSVTAENVLNALLTLEKYVSEELTKKQV